MNNQATTKIRLYRHPISGNAHRAELLLSLLGLDYELIDVDLLTGEQKTPEFLAINPRGQVPALVDGDNIVTESNAILVYLATRYDDGTWLPRDPKGAAEVQRWLSVASHEVAVGPATARLVKLFGAKYDLAEAQAAAQALFSQIETALADQSFLTGAQPTLADVAIYSYVARAPEGGIPLDGWPRIEAWISRVEDLVGFIPIVKTDVPIAA